MTAVFRARSDDLITLRSITEHFGGKRCWRDLQPRSCAIMVPISVAGSFANLHRPSLFTPTLEGPKDSGIRYALLRPS